MPTDNLATPSGLHIAGYDMAPETSWSLHAHADEALLSCASAGSCMQVIGRRTWIVLPDHAVWIPRGVEHAVQAGLRGCQLRTIHLPLPIPENLPHEPCVIEVSPLLKALIAGWDSVGDGARQVAFRVLVLDEIRRAPRLDLGLPRVTDPRLVRAANLLQSDPSDARGIDALARLAGMSRRSFMRHFQAETGMGFAEWRRRLRVLHARQLLAEGASVTEAALTLGYSSPSAFAAMVRRQLGVTPGNLVGRPAAS